MALMKRRKKHDFLIGRGAELTYLSISPSPPPLPQRDVIDAMPPAPWRLEHQPNLGLRFQ